MIRVLQVIGSLYLGGSQTMVMNLYRKIDRSKMQFDFIIDHTVNMDFEEEIKRLGGKIYIMPTFKGYNIFAVIKAWNQFFREHPEYQILHSHVRSYASIYLPIAKKYGLKTLIHSHSTSNGSGISSVVKKILQYPLRYQADCYLSCSEDAGKWLFGKNVVKSGKFQILQNAIDIREYQYNEEQRKKIRNELGLDKEILYGHVGRLHESKNPIFLISVFHELYQYNQNCRLVMVGDGDLRGAIEEKIRQYGIEDAVYLLGIRNDVKSILQAMDCFLFPSCWEGVPVTVVEAQASGLPCFVSDAVTKDVGVSELVHYITIENGTKPWVDAITETVLERKDVVEDIKKGGFDTTETSKWLMNLYMQLLR